MTCDGNDGNNDGNDGNNDGNIIGKHTNKEMHDRDKREKLNSR